MWKWDTGIGCIGGIGLIGSRNYDVRGVREVWFT